VVRFHTCLLIFTHSLTINRRMSEPETKMIKINVVDPSKCESIICLSGGTATDSSKLDSRLAAGKLCFCSECFAELNAGRRIIGQPAYEAK